MQPTQLQIFLVINQGARRIVVRLEGVSLVRAESLGKESGRIFPQIAESALNREIASDRSGEGQVA